MGNRNKLKSAIPIEAIDLKLKSCTLLGSRMVCAPRTKWLAERVLAPDRYILHLYICIRCVEEYGKSQCNNIIVSRSHRSIARWLNVAKGL
jgi:hypothetical protein